MTTNKRRKNSGVRESPFGRHHRNNQSRQEISMGENWGEGWILYNLRMSPHEILTNYGGEKATVQERKLADSRKWWQSPPSPEDKPTRGDPVRCKESSIAWVTCWPKTHNRGPVMRKYPINPHWGADDTVTGLPSWKRSRPFEPKKDWRKLPGWSRPDRRGKQERPMALRWTRALQKTFLGNLNGLLWVFFAVFLKHFKASLQYFKV